MSNYVRKDSFYKQAKEGKQRSRAYYKLKELDQKYKLFKRGDRVLDLGCWPGGWLQYVAERVGSHGKVLGFDLQETEPFELKQIQTYAMDLFSDIDEILAICKKEANSCKSVISDLSPKLTGIKTADRVQSVALIERAYYFATEVLESGGTFLAKAFKSNEAEEFIREIRPHFDKIMRRELKSTRKGSQEFYILGVGYKP